MEQTTLLFDELELKTLCSNEQFKAGKRLLSKETIKEFIIKENILSATCFISNGEVYKLSFCRINNRYSTYCNCADADQFCEHIIALCLHYLEVISPKKMIQEPTSSEYMGYRVNFLEESSDEQTLSQRLDLALELRRGTNEYSFYFIDNKSKSKITESFFFLFDFEKIIKNEKNLEKRRFISFFYSKFGEQFFYPHQFFKINQDLVLSKELFKTFTLYDQNYEPYIFSKEKLELELSFSMNKDVIKLNLQAIHADKSRMDVSNEMFGNGRIPFLIYGKTIYFFQYPSIAPLISTFQKQTKVSLDIAKFKIFINEKAPKLLEKGLKLKTDAILTKLHTENVKVKPYFKIKIFQDQLYLQLYFLYKNRKINPDYTHMYLLLNENGEYCQRNLKNEQAWLNKLKELGFYQHGTVYTISQNKMFEFVKYTYAQKNKIAFSNNPRFEALKPQKQLIMPQISLTLGSKAHLITASCQFYLANKLLNSENLKQQLLKKNKYVKLESTKVHEICAIELILDLAENAEWQKSSSKFSREINIGLAIQIADNYKNICKTTNTVNQLFQSLDLKQNDEDIAIPLPDKAILHHYQTLGINWLIKIARLKLGAILADDMGLGKTLQTLAMLEYHRQKSSEQQTTLIVMPTTLLFNWEYEVNRFYPDIKILLYEGQNRKKLLADIPKNDLVLCSYAILRRDIADLKKFNFFFVILDEAQAIKNSQSKTTQSVIKLKSKHRLALSGTPIENRVSEIWSLFNFLIPGYLGKYESFKQHFELPIQQGNKKPLMILNQQIKPLILRRIKENIALELPPKIENYIYCDLSKSQEKLYKEILSKKSMDIKKRIVDSGLKKAHFHILSLLTHLRQICCHPELLESVTVADSHKFELLQEMVEQILEGNHKIVIFSQFVKMLNIIKKWLEEKDIKHEILTGQTQNRKDVITKFNTDKKIKIILVSLKAGGTGINLTAADYIFHYDPWWNPAVENQATDRVHRIGQDKPVFVYKMITKNTVEDKICHIQTKKQHIYNEVLDKEYDYINYLNDEEIKALLSL